LDVPLKVTGTTPLMPTVDPVTFTKPETVVVVGFSTLTGTVPATFTVGVLLTVTLGVFITDTLPLTVTVDPVTLTVPVTVLVVGLTR